MNFPIPTGFTPPIQPQQQGGKMPLSDNQKRMLMATGQGLLQGQRGQLQDIGGGYQMRVRDPLGGAMSSGMKVYGDIDAEKRAEKKRLQERKERMEDRTKIFEMEEAARAKRDRLQQGIRMSERFADQALRMTEGEKAREARKVDKVREAYQKQRALGESGRQFDIRSGLDRDKFDLAREEGIANRLESSLDSAQEQALEARKVDLAERKVEADLQADASKRIEDSLKPYAADNRVIEAQLADLGEGGRKLERMLAPMAQAGRAAEAVAGVKPFKPKATGSPSKELTLSDMKNLRNLEFEFWELDAEEKAMAKKILRDGGTIREVMDELGMAASSPLEDRPDTAPGGQGGSPAPKKKIVPASTYY